MKLGRSLSALLRGTDVEETTFEFDIADASDGSRAAESAPWFELDGDAPNGWVLERQFLYPAKSTFVPNFLTVILEY